MNYTKNIISSETNPSQFAQCYSNEDLNIWDQLKSDFQKENYLLDEQYINKDIGLKVNYIPSSRNDYFDDDVNYFNNDKNKNYFDQNEDNNEYYTGQKENGQLFNLMNSENFNFQDNLEEEMGLQIINSNHNQQENYKVLGNPMKLNFNQPMQNNQNNDINFNIDCQDSQTSNNIIQNQNDIIYNIPFNENNYEETQNIQLQSQQFMTQVQSQNEKQNYQSRDPIIKIEEELGIKENKQQQVEESQNILSKKEYSCCSMCRNEQNILLHEQIFGVNISKFKEIDPVKLEYVNIIKSFMYLITKKFLEQESNTDNETVKDYKDRVIYSIKKMIEGQYLKKFQFYSSDSKQKNVKNIGQPKLPTKTQPKRKRKARN